MAPNVIETDPGTNYEMADLRDSFYTMAVAEQTTSVHTTAAQRKGKYSCLEQTTRFLSRVCHQLALHLRRGRRIFVHPGEEVCCADLRKARATRTLCFRVPSTESCAKCCAASSVL